MSSRPASSTAIRERFLGLIKRARLPPAQHLLRARLGRHPRPSLPPQGSRPLGPSATSVCFTRVAFEGEGPHIDGKATSDRCAGDVLMESPMTADITARTVARMVT